jgi:hypothetical protein
LKVISVAAVSIPTKPSLRATARKTAFLSPVLFCAEKSKKQSWPWQVVFGQRSRVAVSKRYGVFHVFANAPRTRRGKKTRSPFPSLLLTLTFLFIARSGEGERDGVVESASMVGFFFFKAREEESSRPLIALSLSFLQCLLRNVLWMFFIFFP